MDETVEDRALLLRVFGALMLLVGIAAAFIGPLEMYSFYLFSMGGRFYYEGFGFGAFLFAFIAAQIGGYYLIAVFGILLGWGHLLLRRWAHALALSLLWFWVLLGLPLTGVVVMILVQFKDLSVAGFIASLVFGFLLYPGPLSVRVEVNLRFLAI